MIDAKVGRYVELKKMLNARLCTCFANWWLRTDSTVEEGHSESLVSFKTSLFWNDEYDEEWVDRHGIPVLLYAVLRNDFEVVRKSLQSDICAESRLNTPYFGKGVVEFGLPAKGFILHGAMSFASAKIVEMLLEKGANPFMTNKNGMDACMAACAFARHQNVQIWLSRFKDWDLNRGNSMNGATALHTAVYVGRNKLKTVRVLVETGKANLNVLAHTGASILSNALKNVDSNIDVVRYILSKRNLEYGVNYRRSAKTTRWRFIYGIALQLVRTGLVRSGLFWSLAAESGKLPSLSLSL
jgi:ankyrin repeat protein